MSNFQDFIIFLLIFLKLTDFVSHAGDAPGLGRLIDGSHDALVQSFPFLKFFSEVIFYFLQAYLEHSVQTDLADFGAHRCLCELSDRELGIVNAVGGLEIQIFLFKEYQRFLPS